MRVVTYFIECLWGMRVETYILNEYLRRMRVVAYHLIEYLRIMRITTYHIIECTQGNEGSIISSY
jgi:hypothetical protein